MRLIFGAVLLLGLVLAGAAIHMARGYVGQTQAALAAERAARVQMVPTVEVYVMTRAAAYGEALSAEHVRLARWPGDAVPEGAFVRPADGPDPLFPQGAPGPRVVLRAMEAEEPVLASKVTAPGAEAGITARLEPGMRAFAIRVDVASGVSGFLRPGDVVDVYWTGTRGGDEVTRLVETRVPIIAVDQTADQDRLEAAVARTVTVEATPLQVASLAQAQATGTLSLSLVGAGDEGVSEAIEVDQRRLLGIAIEPEAPMPVSEPRAEPEPERRCSVRMRRGSEIADSPIPCPA